MGSRRAGAAEGRVTTGMYVGIGILDHETGEVTMVKGMHRPADPTTATLTAAQQKNLIGKGEAIDAVQKGLAKSGINVTKGEAANIANALVMSGSLFGGGDLRSKLYRGGRIIGDFKAVTGGSAKLYNRVVRRLTGRLTGRLFKKLFR